MKQSLVFYINRAKKQGLAARQATLSETRYIWLASWLQDVGLGLP
jgi:hypothetical protein